MKKSRNYASFSLINTLEKIFITFKIFEKQLQYFL